MYGKGPFGLCVEWWSDTILTANDCHKYFLCWGFGYMPRTSRRTQSGITSLLLTTAPSTRIPRDFRSIYLGSSQVPLLHRSVQNFLYSVFRMTALRSEARCPVPSQCCRTVVTHGWQKQWGHSSALGSLGICRSLDTLFSSISCAARSASLRPSSISSADSIYQP